MLLILSSVHNKDGSLADKNGILFFFFFKWSNSTVTGLLNFLNDWFEGEGLKDNVTVTVCELSKWLIWRGGARRQYENYSL